MQLLDRRRVMGSSPRLFLVAWIVVAGCGDDTTGGGGTESADEGGDGPPPDVGESVDDTFTPDDEVCQKGCSAVEDCCFGEQPAAGLPVDGAGCPSSAFPNDWACTSSLCVANDGCNPANELVDCGTPVTGLSCREVDNHWFCVALCEVDADCASTGEGHNMPGTQCIGLTDDPTAGNPEGFCLQPFPP